MHTQMQTRAAHARSALYTDMRYMIWAAGVGVEAHFSFYTNAMIICSMLRLQPESRRARCKKADADAPQTDAAQSKEAQADAAKCA